MADFLSTLGELSLGGGLIILLLLVSAGATRSRYAARWRCWAWLLLCLRMALPLSFSAPVRQQIQSPIQLPAPSDQVIYAPRPAPSLPSQSIQTTPAPDAPLSQPSAAPLLPDDTLQREAPSCVSLTLSQLVGLIWAAGAVGVFAFHLLAHLRFVRYLSRWSTPARDPATLELFSRTGQDIGLSSLPRLSVCEGLSVPMLAGIFSPTLLLPAQPLPQDALRYSILHELTHYRRRDILFKALALWVSVLHWFNPMAWLMLRAVERDSELACDDAVLRLLPPQEHATYGQTILDAVARLKGA